MSGPANPHKYWIFLRQNLLFFTTSKITPFKPA